MLEATRKDAWPLEVHKADAVIASWDEKPRTWQGEVLGRQQLGV